MSTPTSMRAARIVEVNKPYSLDTIPVPEPKGKDILVKVGAASFCHTDALALDGSWPVEKPCTGSHEGAGTIAKLGPDVPQELGFKVGDRVGLHCFYHLCGDCEDCKKGGMDLMFCKNKVGALGLQGADGSFAEYVVADSQFTVPIPPNVTFADTAPLMCAGATIYSSIKRCNLSPGDWIIISGCGGGLGHLGIQFAKALGYHVVGIDTRPAALALTESLGACDLLIDATKQTAGEVLGKIRGGRGANAAVILPEVQVAFDFAVKLVGIHGTMCVVSFPNEGFRFSCGDIVFRDIKIIGGLIGPPEEMKEMLELFSKHNVKLIKKEYSLEKVNQLVEDYKAGGEVGKLVVVM